MKLAVPLLTLALLAACKEPVNPPAAPATTTAPAAASAAGNAETGKQLVTQYGCNVCHTVPGIEGPQGTLAPSLAGVASRPVISLGAVQNTPANLAKFIENPSSMNPQSSMPPPGVTPQEAQHLAAYLQTLK
jgi:cytochrome c